MFTLSAHSTFYGRYLLRLIQTRIERNKRSLGREPELKGTFAVIEQNINVVYRDVIHPLSYANSRLKRFIGSPLSKFDLPRLSNEKSLFPPTAMK